MQAALYKVEKVSHKSCALSLESWRHNPIVTVFLKEDRQYDVYTDARSIATIIRAAGKEVGHWPLAVRGCDGPDGHPNMSEINPDSC